MFFSQEQIQQIKLGEKFGLSLEQIKLYMDSRYNWQQMEQIRLGLQNRINVIHYTKFDITAERMKEIRLTLEQEKGKLKFE